MTKYEMRLSVDILFPRNVYVATFDLILNVGCRGGGLPGRACQAFIFSRMSSGHPAQFTGECLPPPHVPPGENPFNVVHRHPEIKEDRERASTPAACVIRRPLTLSKDGIGAKI